VHCAIVYAQSTHSKFIIENCLLPGPAVLPPAGGEMVALAEGGVLLTLMQPLSLPFHLVLSVRLR
jgi:hypothetical protein